MLRQMIRIDRELCNGCGLCVDACHEGAIAMVDGKATLLRDDYCDGLGNCLPVCPTGAISFETREAAPFDMEAVKARQAELGQQTGCPGTRSQALEHAPDTEQPFESRGSRLNNFPVQLALVAENAAFLHGARLLLAADCAAYAHGDFHRRFMENKVTLIACPKLDQADYIAKLTRILQHNDIRSLQVIRMQVPCCGGLERIAQAAVRACGRPIPYEVLTLSTRGELLNS